MDIQGKKKADFCFVNGRVVNVYSGEILPHNAAVTGSQIIYVGPSKDYIGPKTSVIDARGDYILPGFFDAHGHADLFYNPVAYANDMVNRGTAGMFNDGHDLANVLGAEPYLEVMSILYNSHLSFYTGFPAAAPPYPGVEGDELWSADDIKSALEFENVLSLSEVTPYIRVLEGDQRLAERFALARKMGKLIEGHTTGANPEKLNSLALAGVTSCHESLNATDVLERIRLGYYVMLRHGSIRQDLPHLVKAVDKLQDYDTSRLMLVSDGIFADHLISRGNMDWVVKEAIAHGIAPIRAIQMATINPARYFRLDHRLGGISAGRLAHLLIVSDLEEPTPRLVMAGGTVVSKNGEPQAPPIELPTPNPDYRPFNISRLDPQAFRIEQQAPESQIPVIRVIDQTVTDIEMIRMPVLQGLYRPGDGTLAAALISRDGEKIGRGFVKGFCSNLGGIASTVAHETHGLLVLGQNEADMALAANHALELRGGVVLADGGEIRASIPLPLGGICSLDTIPSLAVQITTMNSLLKEYGCNLPYPLWTLVFLTFTSILRLRLTFKGVYDVKDGLIVFPQPS
ncbi:MAG: adenine deaminase C-terminal domain-containing protein [Desulfobacterales bacterium]|nr:adenine deaminase C-terminal domain-containing protein [Desulfobacterales bacterium]